VNARRWITVSAAIAFVQLASSRSPLAAPKADVWTPQRVRTFVVKVEHEMGRLALAVGQSHLLRGSAAWESWINKSIAPHMLARLEGEALVSYSDAYLRSWGAEFRPFNRSKVTIIEQTADRVVADVTELYYENDFDGEAKCCMSDVHQVPFTEAEIAALKDASRYTITRGKDRVWRISDRKPTFRSTDVRDGTPPKVIGR
jgi:hypothetical protein